MPIRARLTATSAALLASVLAVAACGPQPSTNKPLGATANVAKHVVWVGPPPTTEDLRHAVARIMQAFHGTCDDIRAVLVGYNPATAKPLRAVACHDLKKLAAWKVASEAEFGKLAAVVDLAGPTPRTLVLIRGRNGDYGLALVTSQRKATGVVGTRSDPSLVNSSVSALMRALRERSCPAFAKLAYRGAQPGKSGNVRRICGSINRTTLPSLLAQMPSIRAQLLGSNAGYVFFGLRIPRAYVIGVLVAQPTTGYGLFRLIYGNTVQGGR